MFSTQKAALLSRSFCPSPVLATGTLSSAIFTSPSLPGPSGPRLQERPVPLLKDVLPGEDSEHELRPLASLRRAGHDEVCPWLQPQLPAHFFLCEKSLWQTQGMVLQEELAGQLPLVIIELWVADRRATAEVIPRAWGQAGGPWPGARTKVASCLPNPTCPSGGWGEGARNGERKTEHVGAGTLRAADSPLY